MIKKTDILALFYISNCL
uniref:Uncharacterized protein n=1 Tax=Anguilla anguilla TaxID=7936 RepID=A0A0E9RSK7_ANGAN